MATRKPNSEKDVVLSSASAAPVRSRRAKTTARPQHSAPVTETPAAPTTGPETTDAGTERSAYANTVVVERELAHEDIARLAYALWEARGCQGGNPEEDWRCAEQELRKRELAGA